MGYTFIFLLGWIIGLLTGLTERLSDKIKKNRKEERKMTELDLYKFCEDKEMDWGSTNYLALLLRIRRFYRFSWS